MRTLSAIAAATLVAALCVAAGLGGGPAGADTPRIDRYALTPADGGFLRLDRETGATAFCATAGDGYACRPTKEEKALGSGGREGRLEARVAELEAKVKRLEDGLPPQPSAKDGPLTRDDQTLRLPTDEEIDKIAGFFERAMKRMQRFAESLARDPAPEPDQQRL